MSILFYNLKKFASSLSLVLCKKDHHFPQKTKKSFITMRIKTSILMNLIMRKNLIRKNKTFIIQLTTIISRMRNHLRRRVAHTSLPTIIYKNTQLPQSYKSWRLGKQNRIHSHNRLPMTCGEYSWNLTSRQRKLYQSYMDERNIQRQLSRDSEDAVSKKF